MDAVKHLFVNQYEDAAEPLPFWYNILDLKELHGQRKAIRLAQTAKSEGRTVLTGIENQAARTAII